MTLSPVRLSGLNACQDFTLLIPIALECRLGRPLRSCVHAVSLSAICELQMDQHHSTPVGLGTSQRFNENSWNGLSSPTATPGSTSASNNTYLLPTSPANGSRSSTDMYKPKVAKTCGQRPSCLVNASVTYCGNNHIYAFGGFDQYTDEGKVTLVRPAHLTA